MEDSQIESFRVSILLVTYNHESYIDKALNGLLNQVFEGRVEVVVADDASTDETFKVIKQYDGKDDRFRFRYLDNTKNLGITKNYQRGFSACSGEYVAVLEGDDYWITPLKLQRQIKFLEGHLECDLCATNYFVFEENVSNFYPRTAIGNAYRLISARDLIADNLIGNFSTCMYRKSALNELPKKLFEICSYDWIVNICMARNSLIGFLEEPMSVYRLHSNGIWTQTPHIEKIKVQLALIPEYNKLTNNVYQNEFLLLSNRLQNMVAVAQFAKIGSVVSQPTVNLFNKISDYLPPVILSLVRELTPPKLKRIIIRIIKRGAI